MGGVDRFLAGLGPARMVFDLDAFAQLLRTLGSPQATFPALHVAGTNGKGSVCAMAEAVLRAHGEHTGLYTSPHLDHPRERIAINGEAVELDRFEEAVAKLRDRLAAHVPAVGYSYFDFLTALAFTLFAGEPISAAVVETGLGGRLDSTRLCRPRVSCITPIDYDHTAILGDTLVAIAREKAGILQPNTVCVVAPQAGAVTSVLEEVAGEHGCELLRFGIEFDGEAVTAGRWRYRSLHGTTMELPAPLAGAHQVVNGGCALASAEAFLGRPLDEARTAAALAGTRWPGRLEWVAGVLLDGAHNPAGARTLGAYLHEQERPICLVWGMLRDKDAAGFLSSLGMTPEAVVLPRLADPRGCEPERLQPLLPATVARQVVDSVAEALAVAGSEGHGTLCVSGSLTLVAEARRQLLAAPAPTR